MNELYHSLWKEIPKFHQHCMDQQFSNHVTQSSRNSTEMGNPERGGFKFPSVSQTIPPLICEFWRLHLQKMCYVLSLNTTNVCYNLAFNIWIYIYTSTTSLIIDSLDRISKLILAWNCSFYYRASFWSKVAAEIWKTYKKKKTEVYDSSKNFKLLWERKKYECLSKDLWKLPSLYIRHL